MDKERLREVAQEFFDKDEGHENDASCRWLPEHAEREAVDYLVRFAEFVLLHPKGYE